MIQEVDYALKQLLIREVASSAQPELQITFEPPADAADALEEAAQLHLYLYDVRECLEQRDMSLHRGFGEGKDRFKAGRKRAPVYFTLSYLLTARANRQEQEHSVLAQALSVLLRTPKLTWESEQETLTAPLAISRPDDMEGAGLTSLWQSLKCRIRPAVAVVVTLPFDPFARKLSPVVRDVEVKMNSLMPRNSAGAVGFVFEDDGAKQSPLSGVCVSVAGGNPIARTDPRGFFYLQTLPVGDHRLIFDKEGFYRREMPVWVTSPEQAETAQDMRVALLRVEETVAPPPLVELNRCFAEGALSGQLLWNERPAAHVEVRVGDNCTLTDANGFYAFFHLTRIPGPLLVTVPGVGEVSVPSSASGDATTG